MHLDGRNARGRLDLAARIVFCLARNWATQKERERQQQQPAGWLAGHLDGLSRPGQVASRQEVQEGQRWTCLTSPLHVTVGRQCNLTALFRSTLERPGELHCRCSVPIRVKLT